MNQKLFQRKEFLIGAGFAALNLAILIVGVWFLTSKIMTASSGLGEKKASLAAVYQGWQQMGQEQKELQGIEPELEKVNQALLSLDKPIEFINLLEELAQKTNNLFEVNLTTLPVQSAEQPKNDYLSFQISLAGSFSDFMHFLSYLENMKYCNEIELIQISQVIGQGVSQKPGWKDVSAGNVFSVINLKVFTQ